VLAAFIIGAAPASASHSWGTYHWAATSHPFTLSLGDNTTGAWRTSGYGGTFLQNVSTDWSTPVGGAATKLSTRIVTGAKLRRCGAVSGRVEVCNDTYGRNNWLGVALVWTSGGHIIQATVKLNDTYFSTAKYNTREWRRSVMCQEVGHTFGLDHPSEDPEVNTGSCMDYYKVPNISPNAHDFTQLALIYNHTEATATVKTFAGSAGRLRRVRDDMWVEDLGAGKQRLVFVTWADRGARHDAPPAGA
jgi:hypothetical protein